MFDAPARARTINKHAEIFWSVERQPVGQHAFLVGDIVIKPHFCSGQSGTLGEARTFGVGVCDCAPFPLAVQSVCKQARAW